MQRPQGPAPVDADDVIARPRTPAGSGRVVVIDDQGGFVGPTPGQGPTRHAPVLLDAAKGGERAATASTVTRTSPPVLFKTPLTDHPEVGRPAV